MQGTTWDTELHKKRLPQEVYSLNKAEWSVYETESQRQQSQTESWSMGLGAQQIFLPLQPRPLTVMVKGLSTGKGQTSFSAVRKSWNSAWHTVSAPSTVQG